MLEESKTHESYGMVRIGRISGGDGRFFGSHIRCNNYITIEVSEAEIKNDLGRDWFFPKKKKISVKLTPTQFSELITTTNGSGVPCTVEEFNGKRLQPIPEDDKTEAYKAVEYFKERMSKFDDEIQKFDIELEEILEKKTINKDDRKKLKDQLSRMHQEVAGNIPFYMEQFNDSANKIVSQAKSEVDAFTTHIIKKAGLEAIHKGNFPSLLEEDL